MDFPAILLIPGSFFCMPDSHLDSFSPSLGGKTETVAIVKRQHPLGIKTDKRNVLLLPSLPQ
jgi:hypothetical protein